MGSSVSSAGDPPVVQSPEGCTDNPLAHANVPTEHNPYGLRLNDQNLFGQLEISYKESDLPGSHYDREGQEITFMVNASPANVDAMDLVVFEPGEGGRHRLIPMKRFGEDSYSVTVKGEGIRPGLEYGYIPKGPGVDADRLSWVVDPFAKGIIRPQQQWMASLLLGMPWNPAPDNNHYMPNRGVVVDLDDLEVVPLVLPQIGKQVIYEMHVRDLSTCPDHLVPDEYANLRGKQGTVGFLPNPLLVAHFKKLGVNICEPLPIQCAETSWRGFSSSWENQWKYLPSQFMALDPDFFQSEDPHLQILELNGASNMFRGEGIALVPDLVFGHTHEMYQDTGNAEEDKKKKHWKGPLGAYTALYPEKYYFGHIDKTGCENTFNASSDLGKRLVLEAIKFYQSIGVAGGRYDQATILANEWKDGKIEFNPVADLIKRIPQPETISIAEPTNPPLEFQMGRFPDSWMEWHFSARDSGRDFFNQWCRGRHIAARFQGNTDIYKEGINRGINCSAFHDGMQLFDSAVIIHRKGVSRRELKGQEIPMVFRTARALHAFSIFAPGALMFSRGNEYGRSQDFEDNPYNNEEYIGLDFNVIAVALSDTPLDAYKGGNSQSDLFRQQVALLRFVYDSVALRKNLQIFETQEQFDLNNKWEPYGSDGRSVEEMTHQLMKDGCPEGDARKEAWNKLGGFLGNFYHQRPADIHSDRNFQPVYVALWNGDEISFKLPLLPDSDWEWHLCADTVAGKVYTTDPYNQKGKDLRYVDGEPLRQYFSSSAAGMAVFQLRLKDHDSE